MRAEDWVEIVERHRSVKVQGFERGLVEDQRWTVRHLDIYEKPESVRSDTRHAIN